MTDKHAMRWGILATGGIAERFVNDALAAGIAVVSVGSRSQESAAKFAHRFGIERAYGSYADLAADPTIDIVYVATPHPMHFENAKLLISHGKHVLIEKPMTINANEAELLRALAAEANVYIGEAMWTRHLPHMERVREIVESGALGEIRSLIADHSQKISTDPKHRLNALELGGGALLDLGVYPVSFAWDILGAPEDITSLARLGETGADAEVAVAMRHESGALSSLTCSSRAVGPNTAHILGTEGRIDIDSVWYTPTSFTHYDSAGNVLQRYISESAGRGMHFQALAAEQAIRSGDFHASPIPVGATVEVMRTLDTIRDQIGVAYPQESV